MLQLGVAPADLCSRETFCIFEVGFLLALGRFRLERYVVTIAAFDGWLLTIRKINMQGSKNHKNIGPEALIAKSASLTTVNLKNIFFQQWIFEDSHLIACFVNQVEN